MTAIPSTPRCYDLRARDRLAWWVFRRIAHPDVAAVAWQKYHLSRDATSAVYTMPNGSTSGFYKDTRCRSCLGYDPDSCLVCVGNGRSTDA